LKAILLSSLPSLAHRWLVAAVAAAGDGQNILPMLCSNKFSIKLEYYFK
jgi:hypothetical protein